MCKCIKEALDNPTCHNIYLATFKEHATDKDHDLKSCICTTLKENVEAKHVKGFAFAHIAFFLWAKET